MITKMIVPSAVTIVIALSSPRAGALEQYHPKYMADAAWICVERPENEGILNIEPVTSSVSDGTKLTLIGGRPGCLILTPGEAAIGLSFPYPYNGRGASKSWTTKPQKIAPQAGSLTSFELCVAGNQQMNTPHWTATGWHGMWLLQKTGAKGSQECGDTSN
ncbi:MAG TPA: hypothetical protein VMF67_09500 [Rhizomicrobium sp.]|nr:hypothetical protein [Rhizomicrobium sp.]